MGDRVAAVEAGRGATASSPSEVVGRRIGAALVDIALMAVLFVVLGLALGAGESSDGQVAIMLEGAEALLYGALVLLYYFATEASSGRTVGKRLLGLEVVGRDGTPASTGSIAARTLLRVVDSLPALYLLGFLVMLATPRKQRIGDSSPAPSSRRPAELGGEEVANRPWCRSGRSRAPSSCRRWRSPNDRRWSCRPR